jgi:hypothetical protein
MSVLSQPVPELDVCSAAAPVRASKPDSDAGPGVLRMRSSRFFALLAVLGIGAALVLPIWIVAFPPLLDFPNHLARSFVLTHLHDPNYHFSNWYAAQWGPYPYLGMDLTLMGLQKIMPVEMAGRVFITLCALALVPAVWFFLREANPGHGGLAMFGAIAAYDLFFLQGFLNFQLSLALAFVTAALYLRWLRNGIRGRWMAVMLLATATYFTHLIGFLVAGTMCCGYALFSRQWRRLPKSVPMFVPGVVFFVWSGIGVHNGHEIFFREFAEKFESIREVLAFAYHDELILPLFLAMSASILLGWVANRDFKVNYAWLGVGALLFCIYLAAPQGIGETWDVDIRLVPAMFLTMLAAAKIGRRQWALVAVALVIFGIRMVDITQAFRDQQPELKAIAAGFEKLPRDSRILPLVIPRDTNEQVRRSYAHFWSYAVIRRGDYSPYLFDLPGQTPLRITYDPYTPDEFWDLQYTQPVDWDQARVCYDYVWAFNVPQIRPNMKTVGAMVYRSGYLEIYRLIRE